eukprot:11423403-Prorocentrum_lima.AAC.1
MEIAAWRQQWLQMLCGEVKSAQGYASPSPHGIMPAPEHFHQAAGVWDKPRGTEGIWPTKTPIGFNSALAQTPMM